MAQGDQEEATGPEQPEETFAVLVGWSHAAYRDRIALQLQCVDSSRRASPRVVDSHHVVMDRNQAVVLANYLFQITGQTPPRRHKRSFLQRLLGG